MKISALALFCLCLLQKSTAANLDQVTALRLVNPDSRQSNRGRLEVFHSGVWGTVCSNGFTDAGAWVVCDQLGFGRRGSVVRNTFGTGSGWIWLDGVICTGYEADISSCSHRPWGFKSCSHDNDVAISCAGPRDCTDIKKAGHTENGVYMITVGDSRISQQTINVYCDLSTEGEGWLVFQSRKDGREDFFREWVDYAKGFGAPDEEHWIGNDVLHAITNSGNYKLRVELTDFQGDSRFAEYTTFLISSASDNYRLTVSGYSGNAADSLAVHNRMAFSTKDVDNDLKDINCALENGGAWWYSDCYDSNLNGMYMEVQNCPSIVWKGINWVTFTVNPCPLKTVEMKIARIN